MKSTVVDESLSYYKTNVLFQRILQDFKINSTVWEVYTKMLEEDLELQKRTTLSVTNIIRLLEYCLTSTYFIFQGRFYEQQEGAAMGSPISPIVANLYMEKF